MLKPIDDFLNRITMYRLMEYYLIGLILVAAIFGFMGTIHYNPFSILGSALLMSMVAYGVNIFFARVFETPWNAESSLITGLILALIISPPALSGFVGALPFLILAPVIAVASKYILAWKKRHMFNPAAIAVVITSYALGFSASWWVGTLVMAPFVVVGGLLMVRKMRRSAMVLSFLAVAVATIVLFSISRGTDVGSALSRAFFETPVLFFAFIMLTEPLTAPGRRVPRVVYGALVGFLFAPAIHLFSVYSTPELALIVGNIFAFIISPSRKILVTLKERVEVAASTYDFVFATDKAFSFLPGQYMSWTLPVAHSDNRGNRRYFTVASSPTENDVRIGVKFYQNSSTFKKVLFALPVGQSIAAGELAGDFTLPKDQNKKLAFLAGGIGITPFRSMLKHLLDVGESRDVVVVYSNNTKADVAYADILDTAHEKLGTKIVHTLTDIATLPIGWQGERGFINVDMIRKHVPDFAERIFYISGPQAFVDAGKKSLKTLGVPRRNIKTDYFPGFA